MNAYQRVMNTLGGLPVDRPPVFAVLGAYGGKLTGTDLKTLYSDSSAYVAGQVALQKEIGLDLVMSAFDYTLISEAFGGEVAWFTDQAPNMKRPAVRNAVDALSLPLPNPQQTARLPIILDVTRKLAALYKEQVPIIGVLPGPCILPALLVVRFVNIITNHVSSRSNFFHLNGAGDSLISAIPLSIRSFNSSLEVTRM